MSKKSYLALMLLFGSALNGCGGGGGGSSNPDVTNPIQQSSTQTGSSDNQQTGSSNNENERGEPGIPGLSMPERVIILETN